MKDDGIVSRAKVKMSDLPGRVYRSKTRTIKTPFYIPEDLSDIMEQSEKMTRRNPSRGTSSNKYSSGLPSVCRG